MKNAMKKLMSLMLVAVLLVSAMPFAASAAGISVEIYQNVDGEDQVTTTTTGSLSIAAICEENGIGAGEFAGAWVTNNGKEHKKDYGDSFGDTSTLVKIRKTAKVTTATCDQCGESYKIADGHTCATAPVVTPITIVVKVDTSDNVVWTGSKLPANGEYALAENLLTYCWNSSWDGVYTFDHAWTTRTGTFTAQDTKIMAGEEVHIMLKSGASNSGSSNSGSSNNTTNNGVVDEEWMKDIWLYIYVNNDIIQPAKRILLNNYTIVSDHTLSASEIMTVVDDYYKASNANVGMTFKGAYRETSNITALDFVAGRDETTITGLDVDRSLNTVIIKARVTGVAAISSAAADSSNPKTGDTIYTAMVVMGISAASLAAVMYFYNKKRMAI